MVKSSISLNKHWSFERFIHFIYVKYHAEALSSLFSGFLYDSFGLWFLLIYKRKLTCPFLEILWVSRVYGEVMECSDKLRYRQDVTILGCDIQLFFRLFHLNRSGQSLGHLSCLKTASSQFFLFNTVNSVCTENTKKSILMKYKYYCFFWQFDVSNCCHIHKWLCNMTYEKLNKKLCLLIENLSLQFITLSILLGNMISTFLIFCVFPSALAGKLLPYDNLLPFLVNFINVIYKAGKKRLKFGERKSKFRSIAFTGVC